MQEPSEYQRNDLAARQPESVSIPHHDQDEDSVNEGEVANDAQNGFLLRTDYVRCTDQFRGAPKPCVRACGRYLRNRFASPYQRSSISFETGAGFDRN